MSIFATLIKPFSGIPLRIWLLSVVSLINRSGAMVIAFLTIYLTESLRFDVTDAGYIMSCFGIGAIAGTYAGGRLTDRFGYYAVILSTLTISGLLLLVMIQVREFWSFCLILFLYSFVAEAFRPASSVSIRMNSDNETRMRSFSLFRVFVNLAVAVAMSLGGFLITLGWTWVFIADALTCFLAAAIFYIYIPHEPYVYQKVAKAEGEWLSKDNAFRDVYFVAFVGLTFISAMIFMQILWTFPLFLKQVYLFSEQEVGLVCALNGVIVMFVDLPLIYAVEGRRTTMWFVRFGMLLYGLSYLMLTLPISGAVYWAVSYILLISLGETFVMPFSVTWVTKRAPEQRQGQYMAFYGIAYAVANIIAPLMGTQLIYRYGFGTLWTVTAYLAVIGFVGFWILDTALTRERKSNLV